jgi:hypothetical protein
VVVCGWVGVVRCVVLHVVACLQERQLSVVCCPRRMQGGVQNIFT